MKDTIIAVASAAPVFIALEKTNPELVSENTKGLKRDVYKFYKNNLKEISKTDNTENIKKFSDSLNVSVDKLKSKAKDLTDVTMKIAADSIYIAGKVMLDTGAAIEAGIITGLEKTAEFANQPELAAKISEIGVFKDLSNEYSKCYEHSKELDKVVLKIEEIPFTIAELYLTGYVSEVYLATKVILGAGQIVEHAGKFVLEVGAKAVGQDEFASKVQKSHIVDDISEAVDTQLEKTLGEIDKISGSIDVFAAIEGLEVAGNIGETIGEIGSEIAICIAATATGNIPLAVGMITLSACDAGGQAIDVAVDKTGKFTWKETLVGVGTAAVDAASLGLSRGFTKVALKTTETGVKVSKIGKISQKIPGKLGKVVEGSVIAGVDTSIFQLSDVANPILEKQLGIDKDAKIDWKKIGISTGIGFATGGLFAYIGEVIKANKIKKVENAVFKELEILNKKGNNFLKETINEGSSKLYGGHVYIPSEISKEGWKYVDDLPNDIISKISQQTGCSERKLRTALISNDGLIRIPSINSDLAGKVSETGIPYKVGNLKTGKFNIEFVAPEFPTNFKLTLPDYLVKESDDVVMKYCTEELSKAIDMNPDLITSLKLNDLQLAQIKGGSPKIAKYTWHHNPFEKGRLDLVDAVLHQSNSHMGGSAIWGGGKW